jgi:hypothetical protein
MDLLGSISMNPEPNTVSSSTISSQSSSSSSSSSSSATYGKPTSTQRSASLTASNTPTTSKNVSSSNAITSIKAYSSQHHPSKASSDSTFTLIDISDTPTPNQSSSSLPSSSKPLLSATDSGFSLATEFGADFGQPLTHKPVHAHGSVFDRLASGVAGHSEDLDPEREALIRLVYFASCGVHT